MNHPCNILVLFKYALEYVIANEKGAYLLIIQEAPASRWRVENLQLSALQFQTSKSAAGGLRFSLGSSC